ncbi:MAG: LCCL domain-containing protein [Planctomycetaceae bacterium]
MPGSEPVLVASSDLLSVERRLPGILADPGTLTAYRGQIGETLFIRVTGNATAGSVYGSGVYTDDSTLAAAVVHAGVLDPGETGIVMITILPGQANYDAATRHGIASYAYGQWAGSYRVVRLIHAGPTPIADGEVRDDPGNMTRFHLPVGATLRVRVTGAIDGTVWGNEPYTYDSDLSTAAVHAGVLQIGETGIVRVTIQPVQYSFPGTTRNGVTSRDWLPWDGNYRVERAEASDAR